MNSWPLKRSQSWVAAALLAALAVTGCGTPSQSQTPGSSGTANVTNAVSGSPSGSGTPSSANQTPMANEANSNNTTASGSSPSSGPLQVGDTAPDFTLANINGKGTISLKQLLAKGKPILINAWASWCPPCNIETPDLVKMSQKYGNKVQFVGLNLTTIDSVTKAKAFVSHYGIPYPVLLDSKGVFEDKYTVIAEPTTFLISPQGKILDINMGMMISTQMEQLIQSALKS